MKADILEAIEHSGGGAESGERWCGGGCDVRRKLACSGSMSCGRLGARWLCQQVQIASLEELQLGLTR